MIKFDLWSLICKWAVYTFLLFLTVRTVKGLNVSYSGMEGALTLAAAAAVIALINTFIRPAIILLTLPINILSFGLFTLIINAVVFSCAGWLVKGFEVKSLWAAIIGSLVYSLAAMAAEFVIRIFFAGSRAKKGNIRADFRIIE
jgi:putative membrane protein